MAGLLLQGLCSGSRRQGRIDQIAVARGGAGVGGASSFHTWWGRVTWRSNHGGWCFDSIAFVVSSCLRSFVLLALFFKVFIDDKLVRDSRFSCFNKTPCMPRCFFPWKILMMCLLKFTRKLWWFAVFHWCILPHGASLKNSAPWVVATWEVVKTTNKALRITNYPILGV